MNLETLENYTSSLFSVAPRVWGRKEVFVNYFMIQDERSGAWALVDAGLKWSASKIKKMAAELFGENNKPSAIILTHGHFDHVGALSSLLEAWGDVPVYAHQLELPYLNGKSSYPPADPTVGGGMMATMSFLYPTGPIDVHEHIRSLPYDGSIPGFEEWKYIHTPGHSPGHISLFRESDKLLIAGDAFVTTKAESAIYALSFMKHLSGPPKYLTCDWGAAKLSVLKLEALNPEIVVTGHGKPMRGEELHTALHTLIKNFDKEAIPAQGRYKNEPAVTNEEGVVYVPKSNDQGIPAYVKVLGVSLAVISVGVLIYKQTQKRKRAPTFADLLQLQSN
jgi:glyoxylase-like metal-dependent hydrolase (beta-lactamase superfamily II)